MSASNVPVLVAARRGLCAVCALTIDEGELIRYERAVGPRHVACSDLSATRRRNRYPSSCELCGVMLRSGEGMLADVEHPGSHGTWKHRWLVRCADALACDARIRAMQ